MHLIPCIILHSTHFKPNWQLDFITRFQIHSEVHSQLHSTVCSLPDCLTLWSKLSRCSQEHFEYAAKFTSEYVIKYTPKHVLKDAPNCIQSQTPCLFNCTLLCKSSRYSQVYSWVVITTIPGYTATVHVRTATMGPGQFQHHQWTEPPYDQWFLTRTAPKTTVFWPGFAFSRASFMRTQNFGSN